METKEITFNGNKITLLRYNDVWVFPEITYYQSGLGSPVALILHSYEEEEFEYYADVTVNLPDCKRDAGCQFIDTNNNGEEILDWLEQYGFGKRTGNVGQSGFCTYPEFDFYKGEKFWEYREDSEKQRQ